MPSSTAIDPVYLMNQKMQEINASYSNTGASGSGSSSNNPLPTFNRYNVLERLRENEGPFSRPGSPSG